jgi:redox-sensitive bicupin YhaK (pirin superfamily)
MAEPRRINKVYMSKPTLEGAGVHLKRAFGFSQPHAFDPFLLLDDFRNDDPENFYRGFPWHPHRGIETITYVLRGSVEHGDSLGNRGVIHPGDVQWMTAGSGIIHQEMPQGDETGAQYGFQLWANLPRSQKMMDPRYREVLSGEIPEVALDQGVKIRVIAGKVAGVQGPVQDIVIDPEYLDVTLPANTVFQHPTSPGHTVFSYVIGGQAIFCQEADPYEYESEGANYFDLERKSALDNESLVLFTDGDSLTVSSGEAGARFLLISGQPIGEPVAWYGPIVMNSQAELRTAFQELNEGTFIKFKG